MRTIDADALDKTIREEFHGISATGFIYFMRDKTPVEVYNRVRDLIDNAPTVVEDYDTGFQDGLEYGLNDIRPQGEWIYGEDEHGQDGWFCSECRFFVPWYYEFYENDIDFIREYKACPHCLADMVTYTGKDRDMKGGRG